MRRLTLLLIVSVVATAVLALFTLFTPTAQADEVGGIIDTDTTWTLAGSPYIITDPVIIQPGVTLTVEAGVEVQAQPNRGITVNGLLLALGTAVQPITFTSTTESSLNDWHGLDVTGSGTVSLTHTIIRHAYASLEISGITANPVQLSHSHIHHNLVAMGSDVNAIHRLAMHNVTFSDNQFNYVWMGGVSGVLVEDVTLTDQPGLEGYVVGSEPFVTVPEGITLTMEAGTTLQYDYMFVHGHLETQGSVTATAVITGFSVTQIEETGSANINHTLISNGLGDGYVGLGIVGNSNQPVNIQNSTIAQMGHPIVAAADALHRLQMENVTFDNNILNRVIIYLDAADTPVANVTLTPQPGLDGYEILGGNEILYVPQGITLTLSAGATLLDGDVLFVNGHLAAEGIVTDNTSILNFCLVYFSSTGSADLAHTLIDGGGECPYFEYGIGIEGDSDEPIIVHNGTIQNIEGYPILTNANSLHSLQMENVTFADNAANHVFISTDGGHNALAGNVTLTSQPGLAGYEVIDGNNLTIPDGLTLTLAADTTLIMPALGYLQVEGNLQANGTAVAPITFTSVQDNAPGQWQGIVVNGGEVSLAHAELRYGITNLTVNSPTSTITITSSRLISASVDSIIINNGMLNAACSVIAGNGQNGVFVAASGSPSVIITTSEIWGNGVGITNSHTLPVDARYNFWGHPFGPGGIGPAAATPCMVMSSTTPGWPNPPAPHLHRRLH